jgi:bacillithiol synthase
MNSIDKIFSFERGKISQFSKFSKAFADQNTFKDLISCPFDSLDELLQSAKEKKFEDSKRKLLISTLSEQYAKINIQLSGAQKSNLSLLENSKTYTVTTGHQLTLFGGPLYLAYKILQTVKLCEKFNERSEIEKVVPIFWLASEDHDFEEIKSTQLFNHEISWEENQSGPVGRFNISDNENFKKCMDQFLTFFDGKDEQLNRIFENNNHQNYGDWMQHFVSNLFSAYGVLVLNPDHKNLKASFSEIIKKEIKNQESILSIQKQNKLVQQLGFTAQAIAKEINFFYLSENSRTRIEVQDSFFRIGENLITREELFEKIDNEPQNFSPNVILRPIYQEYTLPNLCYIGGGGEMAYWVQLKGVFEQFNLSFPLLMQRCSIQIIDKSLSKRIQKLPFHLQQYYTEREELKKVFLSTKNSNNLDFDEVDQALDGLKTKLISKVSAVSSGLTSWSESEVVRIQKQIDSIKQRLIKELKSQSETELQSIDFVIDRLLPKGTLQERYFHWMHFASNGDVDHFFKQVYSAIEPFNSKFIALELSN